MNRAELLRYLAEKIASTQMWSVYILINDTKKTIYVGVAIDPDKRYWDHYNNKVDATKYWDFDTNQIRHAVLKNGLSQSAASEMAHSIEDAGEIQGYKVIKTAGI